MSTTTITNEKVSPADLRLKRDADSSTVVFGQIVKAMREAASLTVPELAFNMGISRKRLEAIERGVPATKEECGLIPRAIVWQLAHRPIWTVTA